jgi:hypothetical protein
MLDVFVLCRSKEFYERWQRQEQYFPDFRFHLKEAYNSYFSFINDCLELTTTSHCIICHDDVTLGIGMEERVKSLVEDLDANYPGWGVVGNAGISPNGILYRYVKDPHGGPMMSSYPKPVVGIDGNLMLLNVKTLKNEHFKLRNIGGFHGYDILTSLEVLRHGLLPMVDHRLMVHHASGGSSIGFQKYTKSIAFKDYVTDIIADNFLQSINGLISLEGYEGKDRHAAATINEYYDIALKNGMAKKPKLYIVTRTQFDRSHLLERCLAEVDKAIAAAPDYIDVQHFLVSDKTVGGLPPHQADKVTFVNLTPGRYSRTDLLIQSLINSDSDYIWFIDDDDWPDELALPILAPYLSGTGETLLVGNSVRYKEQWGYRMTDQVQEKRLPASEITNMFAAGDNFVPLCSVIFPVKPMRERLETIEGRGDYYEDFFMLLLAMTAKGSELVTVNLDMANISIRDGENTVHEVDRENWDRSYSTFMAEFLANEGTINPALWKVAMQKPAIYTSKKGLGFNPIEMLKRALSMMVNLASRVLSIATDKEKRGIFIEKVKKAQRIFKEDGPKAALQQTINYIKAKI